MRKRTLFLLALAAAIAAFFALGGHRLLALDAILAHRENLVLLAETYPFRSKAIFFVIYLITTGASIPGAMILTIAAGMLFGLTWGVILASFASTIGASIAFLFARLVLRDALERRFGRWLERLNAGIAHEGPLYLLTIRLIPVIPFAIVNLVAGLTKLKLPVFFLFSQLGMLPATLVYVNAGTMLADIDSTRDILTYPVLAAFVALALVPWLMKFLVQWIRRRRIYRRWERPRRFDRDVVVIGAGAAGLVASYTANLFRARVTLVEQGRMGGDCLNTGCVPSKALINVARLAKETQRIRKLDMPASPYRMPVHDIMRQVRKAIAAIEPNDGAERYAAMGIDVEIGRAHIIDPWRVRIETNSGEVRQLTTRSIIIATGAAPALPGIPGLAGIAHATSETLWAYLSGLPDLPNAICIVGGGPIGCELAQAFARLGSDVSIIEHMPQLLPSEDQDVADLLTQELAGDGVKIFSHSSLSRCEKRDGRDILLVSTPAGEKTLVTDLAIIAVGRSPRVHGFGLEELGLLRGSSLPTDEFLATRIPNILAAGDVTSAQKFTHVAGHQGWHAAFNALFGGIRRRGASTAILPYVIFVDPEIAAVGLNETTARSGKIPYELIKLPFSKSDRAILDEDAGGFIKILTEPNKDHILGVTIVGAQAGEMISSFAIAMKNRLGLGAILSTIHAYPTRAEIGRAAAGEWKLAHAPQRAFHILERFHAWRRGDR